MLNDKIKKVNFYLIIFSALFLGILSDYLFYQKSIGISFFIFNLIIIISSLIFAKRFKKKISKIQFFILASIFLFSAGVFLRSNSFLTFYNIAISAYLLLLFFALFLSKNISSFNFWNYFIFPVSFFSKSFSAGAKFIEKSKDLLGEKKEFFSKDFFSVIKGIAVAAPFLIIFTLLLSSADLVFQSYLERIVKFNINLEIIPRILTILVVSYIFIGVFYKISKDKKPEIIKEKKEENRFLGFVESSTILILIESLFFIFIVIQFSYLFGGKDYVWEIEKYITYSEYAKKGFWELIQVSIISFLLIYGIDKFGRKEILKEKKIFKILSAALFFEISIIILSALKRISVYTDGYGLTFSRFLAFVFLFWIFSVFLIFIYKKIFLEKKEAAFLFSVFCLIIIFWAGVNILNPDVIIARENIKRAEQNKELDLFYLSRLSNDAVPEIAKIFQMEVDEDIKIGIARNLYGRYNSYSIFPSNRFYAFDEGELISFKEILRRAEEKQNWQSFNFSNKKALSALKENYKEIVKYNAKFWEKEAEKCWENIEKCKKEYTNNNEQKEPIIWGRACNEEQCKRYEEYAKMNE